MMIERRYPTQAEAEERWKKIASNADPRDATIIRAFKEELAAKAVAEGIATADIKAELAPARNHEDWANDIFSLPIFRDDASKDADWASKGAMRLMTGGRLNKDDIFALRMLISSCLKYGRDDDTTGDA